MPSSTTTGARKARSSTTSRPSATSAASSVLDRTLAELSTKRRWRFDFATDALRNALPRANLPSARYHRLSPRALAALPGFPTAEQLFSDELRTLVARRYADDLRLHAAAFDESGPVYPTGGALAYHQ